MRFKAFVFLLFLLLPGVSLASPIVGGVQPASGFQGATLNLTITGDGFVSSSQVRFTGTGVIVNGVRVVSSTSIIVNVALPGSPGVRTLSVASDETSNSISFEILPSPLTNPGDVVVSHLNGPRGGIGTRDGVGTDVRFYRPQDVWSDGTRLYVVDSAALTIRKIEISAAEVSTLARLTGNLSGIWGDATNLYVRDGCRISRIVIATGEVTAFAGVHNECAIVDGTVENARLRGNGPIWGDGTYLYVVDGPITPRVSSVLPGFIRVISLRTREITSIPLPMLFGPGLFQPVAQTPLGIWGLNGYLYTTWLSRSGSISLGRINTTTHEFERLFNFEPNFSFPNSSIPHFRPAGLWFDGEGSAYFIENTTVRRLVLATGELSTVGTGASGSSLWGVDRDLYISDPQASVVRRVHLLSGQVSVFAGVPASLLPEPVPVLGSPQAAPSYGFLRGIWSDSQNFYITADTRVLKIDASTLAVTTVVTDLLEPHGIWGDGTYLYVAETGKHRVQQIRISTGEISTLASGFTAPIGIWGNATYLYVTDETVIRRITRPGGETVTIAGAAGDARSVDGIGPAARFRFAQGIWGNDTDLYVADPYDSIIRKIRISTAEVSTFAGIPGDARVIDGVGTSASFSVPSTLSGDGTNLYVGNSGSGYIRKIVLSTAEVSTPLLLSGDALWVSSTFLYVMRYASLYRVSLAGGGLERLIPALTFSEGVIPADQFPMTVRWGDGDFLYGTSGYAIYRTRIATGEITHLAGAFDDHGLFDGIGNKARFDSPAGMWGDGTYLYVVDRFNTAIRRVNIATREVRTLASDFGNAAGGDVWGDGRYLYITDTNQHAILRMTIATGEISLFAGGRNDLYDFVDGVGTAAGFYEIGAIWGDGTNLYVVDRCTIRKVSIATAQVTTFAGEKTQVCREHVDGPKDTARFNKMSDIWGNGRLLFVTDEYTVRTVDLLTAEVKTMAGDPFITGTEDGSASEARFLSGGSVWGDGQSLFVSDNGIRTISFAESSQRYSISVSGADYWRTISSRGVPATVGYARIQPAAGSTAVQGVAVFSNRVNGVIVSEAGVPASSLIQEGRIYTEIAGAVNTGIAIANTSDQAASISFYFTDANGVTFGNGITTVVANGQIARFLGEAPFNGTAGARTFTFASSVPVAAIALRGFVNERSEFLMTTLPVASASSRSAGVIVIPHFADGGGWRTQVVLVNPTDGPINGSVEIGSTYSYSIPARSSAKIVTAGTGSTINTGIVRINPGPLSYAPVASTVFSFVQNGITVSESGVATTGTAAVFRVFAELGSLVRTGIAVANAGSGSATVQFELLDVTGQPAGYSGARTIAAGGHISVFLDEIPGFQNLPSSFRGVLRISSSLPISVIGLRGRYNERGDFLVAATPAAAENEPSTSGELVFPHIVSGGGYSTEFLLMGRGGSTNGNLIFRSQSGSELQLPVAR